MRLMPVLAASLLLGCATVSAPTLSPRPASNAAALQAAVDDFYRATTVAQLDTALAAAKAAGPDTALFHELAAHRAVLDGRDADAADHLVAALFDQNNPAALLHLHWTLRLDWPVSKRPAMAAALTALAQHHPSAEVRAAAAYHAAFLAVVDKQPGRAAELVERIDGRLTFDVAGPFDNEQGKAFDQELAPETHPGLDQTYQGRNSREVKWRKAPPVDVRGRLDFGSILYPSTWSAAFAQSTFDVKRAGAWALRLSTPDPIKVWVDDKLVFSAVQVEQTAFDQVVIPLSLQPGKHRVLVKSMQRDGAWWLLGRVTEESGPVYGGESAEAVALARAGMLPDGVRQAWAASHWSFIGNGGNLAVQLADVYLRQAPQSVLARVQVAEVLWHNQERGRTADVLAALDKEVGDALPFVRLRSVRFHLQQGLRQKARERVLKFAAARPDVFEARDLVADVYRAEDWAEDELSAAKAATQVKEAQLSTWLRLASTQVRLGRRTEELATLEEAQRRAPGAWDVLGRLAEHHASEGRLERAIALYQERAALWPPDLGGRLAIADLDRRLGKRAEAEQELNAALVLSPDHAPSFAALGNIAWEAGEKPKAIGLWRRALELNPDDEKLANRLDFVSPEKTGPWAADVPDEGGLERVVQLREKLKKLPGSDVAYLLDHEVTQLNSDGSTQNVVSLVMHALTPEGRDRLTRQSVAGNGRVRILQAWAIDEKGRRSEASSERGRQVFFRGLTVGSTTVLQYRLDAPPDGYLSRHLSKSWSFQGTADQRVLSRFILWLPRGAKLHEERIGGVGREESVRGDLLRVVWSMGDTVPLTPEPSMPPGSEVLANIKLSTIPDWDAWLSWEKALLEGAFRSSPEVDALAKKLGEAGDVPEKVKRIHEYVMQDIRYQQDYETFIAGVKPHPAPMVLERKYGDCKDKAVLFITLAQKLGIDAHFALVRTRDAGPANPNVPMQQFNHAIVYVPEQDGFPAARFYDPTADALDLDVLRADDAGTRSLVFDPKKGVHTWRDIPFQAPEANQEGFALNVKLSKEGAAEGTYALKATGSTGSAMRRVARNTEVLAQGMQRAAAALITGAATRDTKAEEVKDLRTPATISTAFSSKAAARKEGEELRFKVPSDWSPRTHFGLAERKLPLVLGTPRTLTGQTRVELPEGFVPARLPQTQRIALPCLEFERGARIDGAAVVVEQKIRYLCERISAAEYPKYREAAEAAGRALEEDLVIAPAKGPKAKLEKKK